MINFVDPLPHTDGQVVTDLQGDLWTFNTNPPRYTPCVEIEAEWSDSITVAAGDPDPTGPTEPGTCSKVLGPDGEFLGTVDDDGYHPIIFPPSNGVPEWSDSITVGAGDPDPTGPTDPGTCSKVLGPDGEFLGTVDDDGYHPIIFPPSNGVPEWSDSIVLATGDPAPTGPTDPGTCSKVLDADGNFLGTVDDDGYHPVVADAEISCEDNEDGCTRALMINNVLICNVPIPSSAPCIYRLCFDQAEQIEIGVETNNENPVQVEFGDDAGGGLAPLVSGDSITHNYLTGPLQELYTGEVEIVIPPCTTLISLTIKGRLSSTMEELFRCCSNTNKAFVNPITGEQTLQMVDICAFDDNDTNGTGPLVGGDVVLLPDSLTDIKIEDYQNLLNGFFVSLPFGSTASFPGNTTIQ